MAYFVMFVQKLQERASILNKSIMTEKTKEKWSKVLIPEVISSEEAKMKMIVKPLPWRVKIVNDFFYSIG